MARRHAITLIGIPLGILIAVGLRQLGVSSLGEVAIVVGVTLVAFVIGHVRDR